MLKNAAAPFVRGGERDLFAADPAGFLPEPGSHGPAGIVILFFTCVQGRQNVLQFCHGGFTQRDQIHHLHVRFRDGAGFVHAEHIHPSQGFNAVHVLHQHIVPAELQSGGGHGNGSQQVQSLGDHTYQRRDGTLHTAPETLLQHHIFLVKQHQSHRHQQTAHHEDQLVQGAHHFGLTHLGVGSCFGGELFRESIGTHGGELYPAMAGDHKTAGF